MRFTFKCCEIGILFSYFYEILPLTVRYDFYKPIDYIFDLLITATAGFISHTILI